MSPPSPDDAANAAANDAANADAPALPGHRLRRDMIWNLAPVVLLGVVGLGLTFAISKWWGPPAYGVFNLVTTAYFSLAVLGACGIQFSVLRAVAEQPEDRARVAAIVVGALVPNVVLAATATAVFVALRPVLVGWFHSPSVGENMLWAAPALFCFAVNKVLLGIVNGLRRMRAFAIYTSLRYLLIAAGLVVAKLEGISADHLGGVWTFTEGTLLVVLLCELVATVRLSRAAGWTAWVIRHLDYGVRGVVATLAYEVNSKLDVWMLGILIEDKTALGIYALASALNEGIAQLAVVLQNNVNPVIARLLATGQRAELQATIRRSRRWFVPATVAVCAATAIGYPVVIPWLLGNSQFATGTIPFAILMAGIAIASPYLPFGHVLLMAKLPGWNTVLLVATIAINGVGNAVLIPPLGVTGAAIATSITVVASALLLRGLARWRISVRL